MSSKEPEESHSPQGTKEVDNADDDEPKRYRQTIPPPSLYNHIGFDAYWFMYGPQKTLGRPSKSRSESSQRHDKELSPVKQTHAEIAESQPPLDTDSDDILGPMPAENNRQEQNKRPRGRNEFAHDAKAIEKFEQMGFVMSGKRRKRKEPIDEETKAKLQKEEKASRETEIVAQFKAMIQAREEASSRSKR